MPELNTTTEIESTPDTAALNDSPVIGVALLLRHGASEWNESGQWQGAAGSAEDGLGNGLSKSGKAGADAAAARFDNIEIAAIFSSDLNRTMETAIAVGLRKGLHVYPVKLFRERGAGNWQGLTKNEIRALPEGPAISAVRDSHDPTKFSIVQHRANGAQLLAEFQAYEAKVQGKEENDARDVAPNNGETQTEMDARAQEGLDYLATEIGRIAAERALEGIQGPANVIVGAHMGWIRATVGLVDVAPTAVDNFDVFELRLHENNTWTAHGVTMKAEVNEALRSL